MKHYKNCFALFYFNFFVVELFENSSLDYSSWYPGINKYNLSLPKLLTFVLYKWEIKPESAEPSKSAYCVKHTKHRLSVHPESKVCNDLRIQTQSFALNSYISLLDVSQLMITQIMETSQYIPHISLEYIYSCSLLFESQVSSRSQQCKCFQKTRLNKQQY